MLAGGSSTMVESSVVDVSAPPAPPGIILEAAGSEIGMAAGSNSAGEEDKGRVDEGDRSFGGNRWPRQETLALLKIRSDMDSVFRNSSLKGPLWEEVSRKLAELGYHRSAKKCKEKFENVYKYHKRTKDGRTGKSDGKTYRFFDQLEALENLHSSIQSLSPPKPQTPTPTTTAAMPWANPPTAVSNINVPSSEATINPTHEANAMPSSINPTNVSTQAVPLHSISPYSSNRIPSQSFHNISSNFFSTSTSSSTASDDDLDHGSSKRKRKWKAFFRRLTKEVIEKQEELQNKFLQTIERCEQERAAREESWRIQEMARINREHEILVQERSKAAAKDAAVITFLQKISGQQPTTTVVQLQPQESAQPAAPPPPPPPPSLPLPLQQPPPHQVVPQQVTHHQALYFDTPKMTNGGGNNNNNAVLSSPSRWPKAEVQALIKLRSNLDIKYQENGPKAPLWEEISSTMRKLGYNRNAKRCKEKWENINKYFKKVKESNKKRPEDSKTCPYFHQLDTIYKERSITKNENNSSLSSSSTMQQVPLMVQPEQQWPPQQAAEAEAMMEEADHHQRGNVDQIQEDEDDIGDNEEDEYEGNDDFELVANKNAPMGTAE